MRPVERTAGPYPAGALWAEPDEGDAARQMRAVYENRTTAIAIGEAGRASVRALFQPAIVGQLMAQRLELSRRVR